MKIAYCVLGTYNSGGMERVLANKANYLTNLGYEITIITTDQQGRSPYFYMDSRINTIDLAINYTRNGDKNIGWRLISYFSKQVRHKKRLASLLQETSFDLVVSLFDHDAAFLTDLRDGSKKVLEIHFSRFKRLQYGRKGIMGQIDQYRSKQDLKLVQKFSRFVVLTEEDKSYWGNLANIQVIPNANSFIPKTYAELLNKQVIAVGRYDEQKQFSDLIRAWRLVADKAPDWMLKIYGHGPEKEMLQQLVEHLALAQHIVLHPPVSNIEQAYVDSSALAMTSKYEGLPMALLEGQVCGLPLVAYACKCGPRDIIQDGLNGFLVEEQDVTGMAEKLLQLIQQPDTRFEMGNQSRRMANRYREDYIMQQWIDLFDSIVYDRNISEDRGK